MPSFGLATIGSFRLRSRGAELGSRGAALVLIVAFLYLLHEVSENRITIPYWDAWELLPLIQLLEDGQLTFAHLFAQHNEHRPVFSRLALLALAGATDWDQTYEWLLTVGTATATLICLVALARKTVSRGAPRHRFVGYVIVGILTLSLNQWENWMSGWQLQIFINVLAVVAGVYALTGSRGTSALLVAAGWGIVATYSLASGLLYWVVTLPRLWSRGVRQQALWVAIATITVAGYAVGFRSVPAEGAAGVLAASAQTLRIIGAALTSYPGDTVTILTGIAGLVCLAAGIWSWRAAAPRRPWESPWIALASYGLGSAILVGWGRQFPPGEVIASKYAAMTNLFWLGLALSFLELGRRRPLAWMVIPVLATLNAVQARPLYRSRTDALLKARSALYAPVGNPLLGRLYPDAARVARDARTLRDRRLSVYRCDSALSDRDWAAAAAIVSARSRPGDVLVATNEWNAECLSERLTTSPRRPRIVSADESEEGARSLLGEVSAAFIVTGGDVQSNGAKNWLEGRSVPLYRSPTGAMRLLYYPDRAHYARTRLTPGEIIADHATFRDIADLVSPAASSFLLEGWTSNGRNEFDGVRKMFAQSASVYVPVVRDAPRTLRIRAVNRGARPGGRRVEVLVNTIVFSEILLRPDAPVHELTLVDAGWEYGGNVLTLRVLGDDVSAESDGALLSLNLLQLGYGE